MIQSARIIVLLLCLCSLSFLSFAQTNYYYAPEGKTYLDVSQEKILVKFDQNLSLAEQQAIFSRVPGIAGVKQENILPSPQVTLVPLTGVNSTGQVAKILEELNALDNVEFANAFLAHEDGTLHGIQEKVLIRVKSDKDFARLQELAVKLTGRTAKANEFDTFLFELSVQKDSEMNALELANFLHETGEFAYAEPDFLRLMKRMNTNDTYVDGQWSLNNDGSNTSSYGGIVGADMSVYDAWTVTAGSSNIKVAILDEGVDLDHPDLLANMLGGYDATGQNSGGNMSGDDAHGTACAGIVGSVGNNGLGMAGVAYNTKIIPVRIAYSSGSSWVTSNSWIGNAINWSWQTAQADILSNSWGGGGSSSTINNAIDGAVNNGRNGLGSPTLFAAGNDNGANSYPATYSPTISVIAMSMCNERKNPSSCDNETWWGSNYGSGADIAAPGVKIYCTDIAGSAGYASGDYTGSFNGTSSATPNAAGVMALILAVNPSLTETQARFAIESTCDKVGGYSYGNNGSQPNGTWSNDLGYGRVNAYAAVLSVGSAPDPTCDDGIQNGNEAGIDCGGDCAPCPTCNDGVQNGNETGVDCGGSDCAACPCNGTAVTVSITLDNYPEETSWSIVDANGATVASGGTYGTQADGSTVNIDLCLADGCYDFTINDAYGDGICCGYGNGSYIVTGDGSTLASGGSFASSETTNFCLGGGTDPDPTCDDGVQNGNETGVDCGGDCAPCATCNDGVQNGNETGVDCGGDCSACPTCNDGVQNGDETGVDCGGSDCSPCPSCNDGIQNGNETGVDCGGSCSPCATCNDGVQNGDETGVDCGGSCAPCDNGGECTDVLINFSNFDSGWGIWNDGGSDCRRSANDATYANSGSYCVRLRDNTSTSTMTTDNLALNGFKEVTVSFTYYPRSMENGEDFWLQFSLDGGGTYQTVYTWARGTDFNNNQRYNASIIVTGTFTDETRVRFRNDASGNSDWIYIDDVRLTGCTTGAAPSSSNNMEVVNGDDMDDPLEIDADIQPVDPVANVNLFPNPTRGNLNLAYEMAVDGELEITIMDVTGRTVLTRSVQRPMGKQREELNVSLLDAGYYFVVLRSGEQVVTKKFAKIN